MTDPGSVSCADTAPPGDRSAAGPARSGGSIRWADLLVAAVSVAAGWRILRLIALHAVNVLYWDQFTFFEAFRRDSSAWEVFRWQHGPHRQGAAFLLTEWIARATDWNTRADAFMVGAAVCVAAALALWLRRRLYGPFRPADVAIPLLVLTPAQYGVFIHTPNLSHGVGPLVLLLSFCLVFTVRRRAVRYGSLVALDFLLVHTGFGIVAGALAPALFGLCAIRDARERGRRGLILPLLSAALSLVWIAIFLVGYDTHDFEAASSVRPPLAAYTLYVALMFANVLGLKGGGVLPAFFGGLAALAALVVAIGQLARLLRAGTPGPPGFAILTLTSFTLLFSLTTAFGRIALGFPGAQSTRYVPLLVPAFLGLYLRLSEIEWWRVRGALLAASAVSIALATIPMRASEAHFMAHLSRGKRVWVETYLATGSVAAADERAGLHIFPFPDAPELPRMLAFMREHRLNFFADR